eukprot:2341622-Alexandrium_andersonii.AAC.1
MSASLVGSEMCIRDRITSARSLKRRTSKIVSGVRSLNCADPGTASQFPPCLLYTSDAADDM